MQVMVFTDQRPGGRASQSQSSIDFGGGPPKQQGKEMTLYKLNKRLRNQELLNITEDEMLGATTQHQSGGVIADNRDSIHSSKYQSDEIFDDPDMVNTEPVPPEKGLLISSGHVKSLLAGARVAASTNVKQRDS